MANDRTIAIRTVGLSRAFGNRAVLSKVDLEVHAGECVALSGSNGSGKTTLLRCLASSLRPSAGEVRWFGRPAAADPSARRLIGMVAHESLLYPHLTIRENLVFAGRMCGVRDAGQRADRLLESIGLGSYAERLPSRVSRGMRQRVSVARAVVHDPPILLLDEPSAGLDAVGTDWLLGMLLDLHARGRTLCLVTHDESIRHRVADRVLELRATRIEQRPAGPPAEKPRNRAQARAA